jgi:hypothetical protein
MLVPVLIFVVIFVGCAGVAARALTHLGRQLVRTGAEFERLGVRLEDRFLPLAEVVLEQTTATLREVETAAEQVRSVESHVADVLAAVGDITVMVEQSVQPMIATAASVGVDRRRVRAIRAGFGTAIHRLSAKVTRRPWRRDGA